MTIAIHKKLLKKLAAPGVALLLLIVIVASAIHFIPGFSLPLLPDISLGSRTEVSHSQQILTELRPVFALSTVEYTYKSVFPYDFFPEESDFVRLRALFYSDRDVPPELEEEMELYRLCRKVGIDPGNKSFDFVVVTSRVKAGYDLSGSAWNPESKGQAPSLIPVSVFTTDKKSAEGNTRSRVVLRLPEPRISDFIIEDETSDAYQYPDIELTAEKWRLITDYLREKVRTRVVEEGILEHAERRAQDLMSRLLSEAGWEEIRFVDPP